MNRSAPPLPVRTSLPPPGVRALAPSLPAMMSSTGCPDDVLDAGEPIRPAAVAGGERLAVLQIDDDGEAGEVGGVDSGTATQIVVTGAADQGVVAVAAAQQVVAVIAVDDVVAGAAVERVVPAETGELVVAALAVEHVALVVAHQAVRQRRATHALDAEERIARGVATGSERSEETDLHTRRRAAVARGVEPRLPNSWSAPLPPSSTSSLSKPIRMSLPPSPEIWSARLVPFRFVAGVGAGDGGHDLIPWCGRPQIWRPGDPGEWRAVVSLRCRAERPRDYLVAGAETL